MWNEKQRARNNFKAVNMHMATHIRERRNECLNKIIIINHFYLLYVYGAIVSLRLS